MGVAVAIVAVGWVSTLVSGRLFALFFNAIYALDAKLNPRVKRRHIAHSASLAEVLREPIPRKTGE